MTMAKCYECEYRRSVPGSTHSKCAFIKKDEWFHMMVLKQNNGKYPIEFKGKPIIELDSHGVYNGWADWPINFDPIWVKCQIPEMKKESQNDSYQF